MAHGRQPLAQGFPQGLGRMQRVAATHDRGQRPVGALPRPRDLLHVVAFAVGRLVAVEVIDADAVRRRDERPGEGLEGARADRRHHGRDLPILPAELGRRVGHGDLVAELEGAHHARRLVVAEHLAERRVAVAEDGEVLAHTLLQEAEDQRLGEADGDQGREPSRAQRLGEAAGGCDGGGSAADGSDVVFRRLGVHDDPPVLGYD